MNIEEQRMERFQAYLNGTMSDEERVSFDSELELDPNLREEFAMYKKAHRAIAYLNKKELKQTLKTIDAEKTSATSGGRTRKLIVRLAVAASLILIAGFSFLLTTGYFDQNRSLAELSEEYFVPTHPESFRGDNDQGKPNYEEQLVQADLLYQSGDYAGAIAEYKKLSQISNTMSDRAEWNLVMSYLLSESHRVECDALLDRISSDTTHMYRDRAVRLQEEI